MFLVIKKGSTQKKGNVSSRKNGGGGNKEGAKNPSKAFVFFID